ncbi:TAT-variant-translocated molybdopterin oxidoreductase [Aureivirga sp. CE67]|uniref:TAT-variant-translocated molybdopterin oxidoreductase n=1 Tax=Aureivirga sp. CE67 TaxID=1788983 RepID=UPI0018C9310C|nr:TAT-variant-translocated molybdopterin oxidoreductase [Aureivirga sp. CE67]
MASSKKYWKSVEELNENSSIVDTLKQNEFVEKLPEDSFLGDKETLESSSTTRRDFLKYVGFTTAAATLAACEGPVIKSIPYVVKPDDIIPGVPDYYATTIADGFDFANVLVKVREGRPIKIEPNKLVHGETNARVQASVLSMYDKYRLQKPQIKGAEASWSEVDKQITAELAKLSSQGKSIAFLTGTMASPSTSKLIAEFNEKFGNVNHVVYDAFSESAALDAFEEMYGERALADYDLEKADMIVSIGADFIGDWQGGGYEAAYAKGRVPKNGKMSRHIQFESNMTLSGSNADKRVMLKPSEQAFALINLYNAVTGSNLQSKATPVDAQIKAAAQEIKKHGSKAVVLTGVQDKNAQRIALELNKAIRSEVMDVEKPKYVRQGNDTAVAQLIKDMNAGNVGAIFTYNTNPVYTLADSDKFVAGLKKVALSVAITMNNDETANAMEFALPAPHYLESWGDVQIKKGSYSLTQPTIRPLFDTRQFQENLLKWTGNNVAYYDYIKNLWSETILNGGSWNQALHDGSITVSAVVEEETPITSQESTEETEEVVTNDLSAIAIALVAATKSSDLELQLYVKTGMGDGRMASNPWLQEFPDPISRASWDNYLTVSQADAKNLGFENYNVANGALNGSYATLTVGGKDLTVPVYIMPGQAKGSVGLAIGYGRTKGMKEEMMTGVNAFMFAINNKAVQAATLAKGAGEHEFACIQLQNTLMGRGDIVKETTLNVYNDKSLDPKHSWNPVPVVSLDHQEVEATTVDLWDSFDRTVGHHFNLSIDLNACTGCGACVIACHAENNVPVVGKEEVRKSRDMHWLRIDRYFSSEETFAGDDKKKNEFSGLTGEQGSLGGFIELEESSENPQVVFQPVMCQHCNHAPCETVCPVAATSHGRQGQNQMAYNRCVGTRYCANNCPYKVRRFNWFQYAENEVFDFNMNDDLGRMVLNPDVVVRSRGVMEKCSMCIQMTQASILKAKNEGRPVKDSEFEVACSQACGTGAMIFGDVNDKDSQVAAARKDDRAYHLLEHVGTQPNVVYQVKVRNTEA